ncbi:DUF6159 family protein [Salarchaeum sp. JOR-1]|uniref:DUF6159 family protein n=1 Tax=Salarchaeum sp. JOR-1 TaxID=2599399 RepID=UPI0011982D78|nr:DUF6159 family protein [Salarchaeum sp. JOR-1]QDX40118.1 hypothetical protein FQU85_04135 [Salarchaeum sp. JOR-1]
MGIFSRLKTGFSFARRSARALRDHPRLAALPAVAGVAGLLYLAALWGVVLAVEPSPSQPLLVAALLALYFGSTLLASYFTAALMFCAKQVFDGEEPVIRDGLRAAGRNLGPLVAWAAISAVVGVVIRLIESNDSLPAKLVAAVFSVAWGVLTYFVLPVIVFENVGVFEMFSRSKETVQQTWGESLGAAGAVGLVTVALVFLGAFPGAVLLVAAPVPTPVSLVVLAIGVLLAGLVGQTLTGVAKTALYVYATEDETPAYFEGIDFGDDGNGGSGGFRGRLPGSGGIAGRKS